MKYRIKSNNIGLFFCNFICRYGTYNLESGRYDMVLEDGEVKRIKPDNVELVRKFDNVLDFSFPELAVVLRWRPQWAPSRFVTAVVECTQCRCRCKSSECMVAQS